MAHLRRIVVTGRTEHCSPRGWGAWPRALIATRTSQNAREAGLATCSARAGSQLGCATTTNLAHLWGRSCVTGLPCIPATGSDVTCVMDDLPRMEAQRYHQTALDAHDVHESMLCTSPLGLMDKASDL